MVGQFTDRPPSTYPVGEDSPIHAILFDTFGYESDVAWGHLDYVPSFQVYVYELYNEPMFNKQYVHESIRDELETDWQLQRYNYITMMNILSRAHAAVTGDPV